MDARETDFEYAQDPGISQAQVDGIAGGIMDLLEEKDPNFSGVVVSKEPTEEKPEEPPEPPVEQPGRVKIKWQGQEKEVSKDELLDYAQKGFDYTQKTQALAQERDQLAPYQGLARMLQSDPVKAQQVAAILAGQQIQPPREPEKPKFDDPIEQLKWETKQEAIAEMRKEMQQTLQQTVTPLHRQQALNQVLQQLRADPDYAEVHQSIIDMVKAQPPSIQKSLYLQLDQDPKSYLEMFQHFKTQKAQRMEPMAKPTKRETKAPFVDSSGVSAPETGNKERAQKLSKQKASALRSGDPMAIAGWLQESGAIEHLY